MKPQSVTAVILVISALSLVLSAQDDKNFSPVAAAVKTVRPSVVFIQERKSEKGEDRGNRKSVLGVIIDPKGTVVTNHSLVKGLKNIEVVLNDGRRFPAKSLRFDPNQDLAAREDERGRRRKGTGVIDFVIGTVSTRIGRCPARSALLMTADRG